MNAMEKNPYVVVGMPNNGTWRDETAKSMAVMFSYFSLHKMDGVDKQRIGLLTVQGSMIAQQRHMCVKKVVQDEKLTHLMFVDSDMVFPKDLIHRLYKWDKDIVACNCTTRTPPILPVAYDFEDKRIVSKGKKGIEKVRSVGCAIMLMRISIFRKMKPPFFLNDWIPSMGATCGEDVYFCQKVQDAGVDVWIDHETSMEIKHVGHRAYGHEDVDEDELMVTEMPVGEDRSKERERENAL